MPTELALRSELDQLRAKNAELRLDLDATIGHDHAGLPGWRADSSQVWGHHSVSGYRRQVSRGFNPPRWMWHVDRRRASGGYVNVAGGSCFSPREAMRQANRRHRILVAVDRTVADAGLSLEQAAAARRCLLYSVTAEDSQACRQARRACDVAGVSESMLAELLAELVATLPPQAPDLPTAEVA